MSQIEAATKSPLTQVIKGESIVIDEKLQDLFSLWAGIRCAVFERDDLLTASITPAEYLHIYDTRTLPANWKVFIARNNADDWQTRMFHMGASANIIGQPVQKAYNSQRTLMGLKKAIFCIVSSNAVNAPLVVDNLSPKFMTQIHPYKADIEWPRLTGASSFALQQTAYGTAVVF